ERTDDALESHDFNVVQHTVASVAEERKQIGCSGPIGDEVNNRKSKVRNRARDCGMAKDNNEPGFARICIEDEKAYEIADEIDRLGYVSRNWGQSQQVCVGGGP